MKSAEYWWWETWSVYYYYTDITLINNLSWWLFISAGVASWASSTSVSAEHQSNQSIDICNVLKKCKKIKRKKLFVMYKINRTWCRKIEIFMRRWRFRFEYLFKRTLRFIPFWNKIHCNYHLNHSILHFLGIMKTVLINTMLMGWLLCTKTDSAKMFYLFTALKLSTLLKI